MKQNSALVKWVKEPQHSSGSTHGELRKSTDTAPGILSLLPNNECYGTKFLNLFLHTETEARLDEMSSVKVIPALNGGNENAIAFNQRPAPAQELVLADIRRVNDEIARIEVLKKNGFATVQECLALNG